MADVRITLQLNALERFIIKDGNSQFIDEDWWNENIQPVLYPFWSSDKDRLITVNYFSDGSHDIEKKKYVYDRATGERKWRTYSWREPTQQEVDQLIEQLTEQYFSYVDSSQETIQEKLYNEYGRWNKVSWEGVRMIRNFLLDDSDWTQVADAAIDDETKAMWTLYRSKLRDLPSAHVGQDADEVMFPINPTYFKTTFVLREGNQDKEYLMTEDQFGNFTATTYSEYAKRIVMTIASNYKIKNPDLIFAPYPEFETEQDELDYVLAKIQANNV